MLVDASLPAEDIAEEADDEIDEPIVNDKQIVGIPSYGLYWEREKVRWQGTATKLLGQQTPEARVVDFAEQVGVYVLHNNGRVLYVGRTVDSLLKRLAYHNNPSNHPSNRLSFRWNQFSGSASGTLMTFQMTSPAGLKPMPRQVG